MILVFVITRVDDITNWSAIPRPNLTLCILAFITFGFARITEGIRLSALVPGHTLPILRSLEITFISTFFNNFAAIVVGDGYRATAIWKSTKDVGSSLIVVFVDRLLGFLGIVFLVLVYLIFFGEHVVALLDPNRISAVFEISTLKIVMFGIFAVVAGLILIRWKMDYIRRVILKIIRVFLQIGPWDLMFAFCLSIFAQILIALMVHFLVLAFGADIGFMQTLLVMLFVFVASYIPITIGSLGVREGAILLGMSTFGVPDSVSIAAALLSRVMIYFYALAGGVLLLFGPGKIAAHAPAADPSDPN